MMLICYVILLSLITNETYAALVLNGEINEEIVYGDFENNLTLPCHNENNTVGWEMVGRDNTRHVEKNGDLFITNIRKNDSGRYECRANDILLALFKLLVRTPPPPLENVTITIYVNSAIMYYDVEADGGYRIDQIIVRYKTEYATEWRYIYLNPEPTNLNTYQQRRKVEISKLQSNTTYIYQIWAKNYLGDGEKITLKRTTNYEIQRLYNITSGSDQHCGAALLELYIWAIVSLSLISITAVVLSVGAYYYPSDENLSSNEKDPERIELVPNVIRNPGFIEEPIKTSHITTSFDDDDDDDDEEFTTTIHFAYMNGAKAIDV